MSLWLGQEGISPQTAYTAVYISANSFSISSVNLTEDLIPSTKIKIYTNGVYKYPSVSSSQYTGGNTVVTLVESVLSDPCGNMFYSPISSGESGNQCIHTHDDGNTGGSGVQGSPPDHEISGSYIRWRQSDGSWGEWILTGGTGEGGGSGSGTAGDETYFLFYH